MKKLKLALTFLTVLAPISVYANGFYIGPTVFVQHISASNSNYTGMHPRLSLGYDNMLEQNYYLAAELFAVPTSVSFSSSTDNGAVNAKITRSFGISLLPGIIISDSVIGYLRLGVVNSKFNGPNKTKSGGSVGVGLQSDLTSCWSARGEYNYTKYSSMTGLGSPTSNEFGLGVIYRFA